MTILFWQDDETGQTESVEFDTRQSEEHEDLLTITDHPVEQGANVSDHAREEPTRLTIEGTVSSLPNPRVDKDASFQTVDITAPVMRDAGQQIIRLDPPEPPLALTPSGLLQAGVGALVNAITGGPNLNAQFRREPRPGTEALRARGFQQNAPRNRVRDVYDLLLKAQQRRFLITVQTRFREHFDMLIERVAQPRSVEDGSSARFQVDLRRIRISESQTVQAPKPTEARGKTAVNKGSQATKPKAEAAPVTHKSLAAALADAGVKLLPL